MSSKTKQGARSSRKANVEVAQGAPAAPAVESADLGAPNATPPAGDAPVSKPRGKRQAKGEATLQQVTDGSLANLGCEGKSEGTIFSYRMDLAAALEHFGGDTPVASLTPAKVAAFYASDGVTKKRNGKRRSEITIAKTRRVFRLALVWAAEKGLIEKAPIPAEELERARGAARKDGAAVKAARKATRKASKPDPDAEPVAALAPEPATQPAAE
jgi:hypothetical protein